MTEQRRRGKYPDEMRERAVRMVFEAQRHCGSQWEAISSVAEKLGPTPVGAQNWVVAGQAAFRYCPPQRAVRMTWSCRSGWSGGSVVTGGRWSSERWDTSRGLKSGSHLTATAGSDSAGLTTLRQSVPSGC